MEGGHQEGSKTYGRLLRRGQSMLANGAAAKEQSWRGMTLTRNDVTGIHGVLVLDEAKAVHQLDLGDFTSSMGRKMSLDILLGDWAAREKQSAAIHDGRTSF